MGPVEQVADGAITPISSTDELTNQPKRMNRKIGGVGRNRWQFAWFFDLLKGSSSEILKQNSKEDCLWLPDGGSLMPDYPTV